MRKRFRNSLDLSAFSTRLYTIEQEKCLTWSGLGCVAFIELVENKCFWITLCHLKANLSLASRTGFISWKLSMLPVFD